MINGGHVVIYSVDPEADRRFFRDVLKLPNVDVGDGWLIFGLPPSEVAMHPAEKNGKHAFYLMCAGIEAFVAQMTEQQIECSSISDEGWGKLVQITLPGGGKLGVYEPRHKRPDAP